MRVSIAMLSKQKLNKVTL